jgi:hypothetical protein
MFTGITESFFGFYLCFFLINPFKIKSKCLLLLHQSSFLIDFLLCAKFLYFVEKEKEEKEKEKEKEIGSGYAIYKNNI